MIRLIVVEDSDVVRRGLLRTLDGQRGISVVGHAADGEAALALLRNGMECELVLADLNMPVMDGFELSARLRQEFPELQVIILTMHAKADFKKRARETGVAGYLLKHLGGDELGESIRLIATGIRMYM